MEFLSLVLSGISRGEVKNLKIPERGEGFKKVMSSFIFFSRIAHTLFMSEWITFILYVKILLVSGPIPGINGMCPIFQK